MGPSLGYLPKSTQRSCRCGHLKRSLQINREKKLLTRFKINCPPFNIVLVLQLCSKETCLSFHFSQRAIATERKPLTASWIKRFCTGTIHHFLKVDLGKKFSSFEKVLYFSRDTAWPLEIILKKLHITQSCKTFDSRDFKSLKRFHLCLDLSFSQSSPMTRCRSNGHCQGPTCFYRRSMIDRLENVFELRLVVNGV